MAKKHGEENEDNTIIGKGKGLRHNKRERRENIEEWRTKTGPEGEGRGEANERGGRTG